MYKTEQEIHEQHVALQQTKAWFAQNLSLIHISEPTRH